MQLFISESLCTQDKTIHIQEQRIVHQCYTVLRMKKNDQFLFQDKTKSERHTITIQDINKKEIIGHIGHTTRPLAILENSSSILCIALPNRMDKLELITQKLTEIGISQIVFFVASRSTIRELKEKTLTRLHTIALEATEQSFGRFLPKLSYYSSLDTILHDTNKEGNSALLIDHNGKDRAETKNNIQEQTSSIYAYIGPEGGFTEIEKDKIIHSSKNEKVKSLGLGSTNLRMETAAIVTARLLKNR